MGILKAWNVDHWEEVASSGTGDFLPLTGGTLSGTLTQGSGVVQFPNVTGAKILTYSNTFGIGVESGESVIFGSSKIGFRQNASNGAYFGYVDAGTGGGLIIDRDNSDARYVQKAQHYAGMTPGPFTQTKLTINVTIAGRYIVQWGASYKPTSGADWWSVPFYVDNAQVDISTSWLPDAHAYGGTRVIERDFTAGNHTFGISGQVVGDDHDTLTVVLLPTT